MQTNSQPLDERIQPIPFKLLILHLILSLIIIIPSFSGLFIGCNRFYLVNSAYLATAFLIIHLGTLFFTRGVCFLDKQRFLDIFYIGLYILFFLVAAFVFWAFLVSCVGIYCEHSGWAQKAKGYPAPICHNFSLKTYSAGADRRQKGSSVVRHDCTFHYEEEGYVSLRHSGLTINSFVMLGAMFLSPILVFELLVVVALHQDLKKEMGRVRKEEDMHMQMSSLEGVTVAPRRNNDPGPSTSYENPNHDPIHKFDTIYADT